MKCRVTGELRSVNETESYLIICLAKTSFWLSHDTTLPVVFHFKGLRLAESRHDNSRPTICTLFLLIEKLALLSCRSDWLLRLICRQPAVSSAMFRRSL